ncbi:MAG: M14 family murein peptide amidase A [Mariprofundales bacterium]|nr:M14 family murein peptide amidase A [Mariprofundales bacterium]
MTAECTRIGHKLGSVSRAECLAMEMHPSGGHSAAGQLILMREFPPVKGKTPRARVLLIGGTHGDEYAAVSVVFKWMGFLRRYHSGLFHWQVVPLLNPDGLLQRHSQRMNSHGVDLNRNMDTPDWESKSKHYWIKRTHRDPRRYPGESPASEPETQWLQDEIARFQPDVIVSVHAPYGLLDFDGPPKGPKHIGYLYAHALGTYPGSLGSYAGSYRHIPVITMELPYAGTMPTATQIHRIWIDLIHWIKRHIPKHETTQFRRKIEQQKLSEKPTT